MTPATDKALADRDRLWRRYRAAKKAALDELCRTDPNGDKLQDFAIALARFTIDDADEMIAYVARAIAGWLKTASEDIRFAALELISNRVIRIRQRAGLEPFDDPLPVDDDDLFQLCKQELVYAAD